MVNLTDFCTNLNPKQKLRLFQVFRVDFFQDFFKINIRHETSLRRKQNSFPEITRREKHEIRLNLIVSKNPCAGNKNIGSSSIGYGDHDLGDINISNLIRAQFNSDFTFWLSVKEHEKKSASGSDAGSHSEKQIEDLFEFHIPRYFTPYLRYSDAD